MRCNKKKTDTNLGSRPMETYEFFTTIPKNSLIFKHISHDFPVFFFHFKFVPENTCLFDKMSSQKSEPMPLFSPFMT